MTTNVTAIFMNTNQKMLKYIVTDVEEREVSESKERIDDDLAHSVMMNIDVHGLPPERGCLSRSMKKRCRSTRLLINYCERDRNINFSDYLNEEQMGMLMLFKLNRF